MRKLWYVIFRNGKQLEIMNSRQAAKEFISFAKKHIKADQHAKFTIEEMYLD